MSPDDERSVGEVLAAIVEHADFVLTIPATDDLGRQSALIDHMRAPDSHRLDDFLTDDLSGLFDHSHHTATAYQRVDPLNFEWRQLHSRDGVWTLSLASDRPFHPQRLMDSLEDLGGRRMRSRGHFWLPTRPFSACLWDGAGGQLSIGNHGEWDHQTPGTRLRFTGVDPDQRQIVEAFDHALLTGDEESQGPDSWFEAHDPFDAWLGRRSPG
jgi:G3E family GTPase